MIEERIDGLDSSQEVIIQIVTKLSKDVKTVLDMVNVERVDMSARLNVTMRSMAKLQHGANPIQQDKDARI